jgi:hypothetical protein
MARRGDKAFSAPLSDGDLLTGGDSDSRPFRESNAYFARHGTTIKRKPELYQELKQYVIVVFNELHQIQFSPRQMDNDADLALWINRTYLVKIHIVKNMAHIFRFNT